MARKSTKASEARDRARERANRFIEREHQLLGIAELFEEAQIELEGIDAAADVKIAKIRMLAEAKVLEVREQARADASEARDRAEQLQRNMLEQGITRKEVGERLGVPTREVARTQKEQPSAAPEISPSGEDRHDR